MESRNEDLMVDLAAMALYVVRERSEWTEQAKDDFVRLMRTAQGIVVTQDLLAYGYINAFQGLIVHKDKYWESLHPKVGDIR